MEQCNVVGFYVPQFVEGFHSEPLGVTIVRASVDKIARVQNVQKHNLKSVGGDNFRKYFVKALHGFGHMLDVLYKSSLGANRVDECLVPGYVHQRQQKFVARGEHVVHFLHFVEQVLFIGGRKDSLEHRRSLLGDNGSVYIDDGGDHVTPIHVQRPKEHIECSRTLVVEHLGLLWSHFRLGRLHHQALLRCLLHVESIFNLIERRLYQSAVCFVLLTLLV
mmetsp:Transcript_6552/g.16816  ORF Transcript_6552/g.16816 Transcript_6552/m.16816 type:complete len:220 (-) Transcript_6552:155-814(-)